MSTFFFNDEWLEQDHITLDVNDRALQYGDGVFETLRYDRGQIHWAEDHYFRLMANMRIMRMQIPEYLTPEYFTGVLNELIASNHWEKNAVRLRFQAWRKSGGAYTPDTNGVNLIARAEQLSNLRYELNTNNIQTDVFKDFHKPTNLLSSVKSCNAQLYVLASVFKQENNLDECFLLNEKKHIIEAISSNVMLLKDKTITTPPTASGALKGIMRKRIVEKLAPYLGYDVQETNVTPFDLNKADEIWLTNSVNGLQTVTNYRKKTFGNTEAKRMVEMLNAQFD